MERIGWPCNLYTSRNISTDIYTDSIVDFGLLSTAHAMLPSPWQAVFQRRVSGFVRRPLRCSDATDLFRWYTLWIVHIDLVGRFLEDLFSSRCPLRFIGKFTWQLLERRMGWDMRINIPGAVPARSSLPLVINAISSSVSRSPCCMRSWMRCRNMSVSMADWIRGECERCW